MASSVLRSAGQALRRTVPQGSSLRSPLSGFAGRPSPRKYSTSSSGVQTVLKKIAKKNMVNEVKCELLDEKADVLAQVIGGLKKQVKELELTMEQNDAIAKRYARQGRFKMLAGATVGFGLGFYAKQCISD